MQRLPSLMAGMESHIASADRVFEILNMEREDFKLEEVSFDMVGAIEFENVTFDYGDEPVIRDLSLAISMGERHAFVGPTGSGKSTIARFLLQLHRPWEGKISICGREFGEESIRHLISYVLQEPFERT